MKRHSKTVLNPQMEACIQACVDCVQECELTITFCLEQEDAPQLLECLRLCQDCADICVLAARFMSRSSDFYKQVCEVCAMTCELCQKQCEKHNYPELRRLSEIARNCAQSCRHMMVA